MEIIERFTPDGFPTGEEISRDRAHAEAIPHRTVHVWFVNSAKELLIQKRALCKESHPGLWDISAAGHIPFGESAVSAAVRECEEELGINVTDRDLLELFSCNQEFHHESTGFHDIEWPLVYMVRSDFAAEECTLQESEVAEVRWVGVDEFSRLVDERSIQLVPHWDEYSRLIDLLGNV